MACRSLSLALAALAALSPCAAADTIHLKNGRQLHGTIVSKTSSQVVLDVGAGQVTFAMSDVASLDIGPHSPLADTELSPSVGSGSRPVASVPTHSTSPPPPPSSDTLLTHSAPATATLVKLADDILPVVAQLRGLEPTAPVVKRVVDKATIRAVLQEEIARHHSPEKLTNQGKALIKFGLLPSYVDFKELIVHLYTNQIAGMYDPHTKVLYLADWIPEPLQIPTVAHELVHALQDQHFDLERYMEEVKDNSEAANARQAVMEGEAMAVMLDYQLKDQGLSFTSIGDLARWLEVVRNAIRQGNPGVETMPTFLQEMMLFPYLQGMSFLREVRTRHPWSWAAALYHDPPQSTEQIMHPERYLTQRDDPTSVTVPEVTSILGPSWTRIDEDIVGEFAVRSLIRQFVDGETATVASEGWDGDRYQLYEHAETKRELLVWLSVWDTPGDAQEFLEAYRQVVAAKYFQEQPVAGAPDRWQTEADDVLVRRQGAWVLVVEGAPAEQLDALVSRLQPALPGGAASEDAGAIAETGSAAVRLNAAQFYEKGKRLLERYQGDSAVLVEAKGYFQKAVALEERFAPAYLELAKLAVDLAYQRGLDYDQEAVAAAQPWLEKAAAIDPNAPELYDARAAVAFAQKHYEEAEAAAQRAIQLDPQEARYDLRLGRIAEARKALPQALEAYQHALAHQPNSRVQVGVYDRLASVYERLGDMERAADSYQRLFALDATHPWAWVNYCAFLNRRTRYDEAIQACQHALQLMNFGMGHVQLARAYLGKGQLDEADAEYRVVKDADGLVNVATAYSARHQYDKATELCRLVLTFDPHHSGASVRLGYIALDQNRLEDAQRAFQQAVEADQKNSYGYYGLGLVAERRQHPDQAASWYHKAAERSPKNYQAIYALGRLAHAAHDCRAAMERYQQVLALNPKHADAHFGLGSCYGERGDDAQAVVHYQTYLQLAPSGDMADTARAYLQQLQRR